MMPVMVVLPVNAVAVFRLPLSIERMVQILEQLELIYGEVLWSHQRASTGRWMVVTTR